jgi:hypothetical protein
MLARTAVSDALFLVSLIAVLLLFWWLVQNDRGEPDSGYKGLFALRRGKDSQTDSDQKVPEGPPQPRWRRPRS